MVSYVFLMTTSLIVSSQASFVQKSISTISAKNEINYVGDFEGFWYKVGGQVYLLDDQTIFIVGFSYSGGGPAAYFWVGTQGSPGHTVESTTAFLAYPFHGRHFQYSEYPGPSIPRTENMNITLTLPPHITTSMVRWLSVWCKPFRANFGQIIFPSVAVVNIDHKNVGEKQDDNIHHKELGEKQDDKNRTESRSDEATEIILNEYVFEAPPVTEAVSEKMKEMKARQGKSFPDKSDKERMSVTEDDTKVESSDKERMDVTEDDTKVESSHKERMDVTEDDKKVKSSDKERMDVNDDDTKVESSDKERVDVTEDDKIVESSDKEVTDDEPKAEPNDKDVIHNEIKLKPIDDMKTYEKHSGQEKEKTDSSSITILPSMFLFIIVVLII